MNQLEKQLQSWIPRPPSAGLRRELFTVTAALAPEPVTPLPVWLKFAPAMCILLLVTCFCTGRHYQTGYLAFSGGSNVMASLSSNLLEFCATDTQSGRMNRWVMPAAKATFDWTRDGNSLSTTGSFPLWKTNIQKL